MTTEVPGGTEMTGERLAERLSDARSWRVVFVSHCLLNQNVRYLGGAFRPGIVPEAIDRYVCEGIGLYQMPCPEQVAWGGVLKRLILRFYGARGTWAFRMRGLLLPLFRFYTRQVYRRLARRVARHAEDYARAGFEVVGVVGVADSPSCGVKHTLDLARSFAAVASLDLSSLNRKEFTDRAVRACRIEEAGLFIAALRHELDGRRLAIPFTEHEPPAEPELPSRLAPKGTSAHFEVKLDGHEPPTVR